MRTPMYTYYIHTAIIDWLKERYCYWLFSMCKGWEILGEETKRGSVVEGNDSGKRAQMFKEWIVLILYFYKEE